MMAPRNPFSEVPVCTSFDITAVDCPVILLHGSEDNIVDPVNAQHTSSLIPQATLRIEDGHGHLSVTATIVEPLMELVATTR